MILASTPLNYGNIVSGSNAVPDACSGTYFYARFTGLLVPLVTGLYTIGVNCQDGCNLFVGDKELINNVKGFDTALSALDYTQSGTLYLTAGVQYPITIEWAVGVGGPCVGYQLQLIWTPPASSTPVLIPATCLTDSGASVNGFLDGSWWNGTQDLYYPTGNATIDFANAAHPNKNLDNIGDGSTYARVLSSQLSEGVVMGVLPAVFRPESYGAVGDGVTDDTVAIQAAIAAAGANGGGTVVFGAKTYLVTASLTITVSNVCLQGVTSGSTTITCNSSSADILQITGTGSFLSGTNVFYNRVQDIRFSRSVSPAGTASGVHLTLTQSARFLRVECFDNARGFWNDGAGNALTEYTQCEVASTATTTSGTAYGWYLDGGSYGNYSGRNLDSFVTNASSGASVIYGMYITGAFVADIYCEGFETSQCDYGVYIDAGTFGTGYGISSYNNDNLHFVRCVHDNVRISAYYINNLYGYNSFVEITGGYVAPLTTATAPLIDIENSAGVVISNVDVRAGASATGTNPGIYINGSHSTNNIISGCSFYIQNAGTPIVVNGASNNTINNNAIYGYAGAPFAIGIKLTSSSRNTVDGNNLSGTGTTGISLDASSNNNGGTNVVDPTSITTQLSDLGSNNFVTVAAISGSGTGTVTHTSGALTSNAIILGNAADDVKAGPTLPGNAALYLDGTGAFSTPAGGGGGGGSASSLFTKTLFTTSQRALGSVYQNTTGLPIIVMGWVSGGGSTLTAVCDSGSTPTTVVVEQDSSGGFGTNFMFIVPNNDYYEVTSSGGSAVAWAELQIITGTVTFSGELSGSRTIGTTYQNTSGKAVMAVIDLSSVGGGTTIQGISDSGSSPSDVVWQSDGVVSGKQTICLMIPNNHYYKVTCSGASVAHWNEYSLPFNAVKSIDYAIAPSARHYIVGSLTTSGVQANAGTGKDMFFVISTQPSQTGSLIVNASFCNPPGLTPYDNTTMSNNNSQHSAAALFVSLGEFYSARQDAGSPTLDHWWEYTLG